VTTPLQIRVSLPAQGQIEEAAAWWAENRPAAPGAIRDDLADILNVLVRQPGIGYLRDVPASKDCAESP